jgi:hypothetical protein
LNSIIVKELAEKSVVWFQPSNQYLVLEHTTAMIIKGISEKRDIKTMAADLERDLDIPFEKAIDFILDLEEKIVKPNTEIDIQPSLNRKNYTAPSSFGYTKHYMIHEKSFKVKFSSEFEVSLIHPKFAHLEVPSMSRTDHHLLVFNSGNFTYLVMDEELIGSWSKKEIHYFQGKFSMKIIESIYEKLEEKWMGVFHASALSHEKNSVLVLGDSGSGKSTSLALLQAHGFKCVADDFVPIDNQEAVHAFPAGISIKKNSLPVLLPLYPELETSAEYHYKRLNKTVRYLPPKDIDFDITYPCKALIFITYNELVEFELEEVSQANAFEYLVPDSWISQHPNNVATFLDWFAGLPCYQLTYANNQKMIEAVGKILQKES